jgi:DNA-binding NarL/FixJ family response regulator
MHSMRTAVITHAITYVSRIRVLVVDDHDLVRLGVLLAHKLRPDIVLMDVRMPHMSGTRRARCEKWSLRQAC